MAVAERDHPVQTFLLDRSYETFGVRIGVGCVERRLHHADPERVSQSVLERQEF
jgi:hypothetical protein